MPNSCLLAIATKTRFKVTSPVASKLRELDITYSLATNRLAELNGSDLKALAIEGQRRALQQIKSARNADELAAVSEPSRGALAVAASEQRQSLKSSLRAIAAEAVEMVRPETARFLEGAGRHLDGMLAEESALSLAYGVEHRPSPLLQTLKDAVGALTDQHAKPYVGQILRPSSLVENFAPLN
jgi:hypothetical protein